MRRAIVIVCLAALAFASAGCASLIAAGDPWAPLERAFVAPVPDLERAARGGDISAQFSMAFLTAHGLRGVPRDPGRAMLLRIEAGRPRSTMIMQYIPGVNGAPGRTMPLHINVPGLPFDRMRVMEHCGLALLENQETLGRTVCTDPVWDRLEPLARDTGKAFRVAQARAARAERTPAP